MTKELLKNIEEWQEKLRRLVLSNPPSSLPFDEFISQIATAERKAGREEIIKLIPEEKDLAFELPPDMEFGRQRVIDNRLGYNDCIADIKSKLNNTEREK